MAVALTTRGIICHKGSQTLSLISCGFLCTSIVVGGLIEPSLPDCTFVYNKESPQLLDPTTVALFAIPALQVTGQSSPILVNKRSSLSSSASPSLYKPNAAQITGSKVITIIGNKNLLLTEPEEPTLTSSGTKAPDIFDKDC